MTSVSKNIVKCVVVLLIIAGLAGLLLGVVYDLTFVSQDDIVARELANIYPSNGYKKVASSSDASLYEGSDSNGTFHVAVANGKGGYSGDVPIYLKISNATIADVKQGTNQETITSPFSESNLSQFIGVQINSTLEFTTSGAGDNKVDTVTGATKTSNAIIDGVNKGVAIYVKEIGATGGGSALGEKVFENSVSTVYKAGNKFIAVGQTSGAFVKEFTVQVEIDNGTITSVKEGENGETITTPFNETYLNQFVGVKITADTVFATADGSTNKIDAVTGATRTSNAIIAGVNNAVKGYNEYMSSPLSQLEMVQKNSTATLYMGQENGQTYYMAVGTGSGFNGNFEISVKIMNGTITGVTAGEHKEDKSAPFASEYLNKFVGVEINNNTLFASSGGTNQVDAIAGATVSTNAVIEAVNNAVAVYREYEVK